MGISRIVSAPIDWIYNAETTLGGVFRLTTVFAGVVGAVAAPFVIVGMMNANELERSVAHIDRVGGQAFRTVDECTRQIGNPDSCQASFDKATGITSSLGTTLRYNSASSCASVHPNCRQVTSLIPITTIVNNVPITTYVPNTNHYPRVVGWQTARGDLSVVAPLFETHEQNKGMRIDRTRITLSRPQ